MAALREIKRIQSHLLKALAHLSQCPQESEIKEMVLILRGKASSLRDQRESLLLTQARKNSTLQYRWSWWAYPVRGTGPPSLAAFCLRWYDYQIDAVTAACKDPCLKRSRDVFYVCQLQTRSEFPDVAGPLVLYDCMAPWTEDGDLPMIGTPEHPVSRGESSDIREAVYAAHERFKDCDEWDRPSGIKFILLETRGF